VEANLDAAKHVLRGLRKEVSEITPGSFVFTMTRDQRYVLKSEDLSEYLARQPSLARATETQLFTPGYYEHVVRFEGYGPRRYLRRGDDTVVLTSQDGATRIELSGISTLFCLCLMDVDTIDPELRRFSLAPVITRGTDDKPFNSLFRLVTIKVTTPPDTTLGKSRSKLHELAEAAVFHIAYGHGTSISFTKTWERTYYWIGRKENEVVQFPRRSYKSELVSYYNLALASDSLILGYLALYKILEYFYTSVSEDALHRKVSEHLVAPDFSHTKTKKLRDLIKAVRQFDNKHDELSSLKLVLASYFETAVLREWIETYEKTHRPHFTIDTDIFGTSMRVDTSDNTIRQNISSRIYAIRNALVHNKEGEVSRFVPYTGQEEILQTEVQLLLYLYFTRP
jgi:hypothetical protein